MEEIYADVRTTIVGPGYTTAPGDPRTGKPYLVLEFGPITSSEPPRVVRVTANLAEMLGGIGKGVNERIRDLGLA